ncbi:uncharacterized protein LOC105683692 isoform X1 [Athalia rosae]|uniref:uncharacterized protein LOC105683692 isoform X1 n=1 Tax=Athalia rosae TaxID=37344 RepID=UPI00203433E1|nr:uncharacterized protein LOC105683692 isoform X1 [Athalia rosae]
MPKRICPFDDDLAPQMKIHVGQKEVNNGVQKDIHMKKVYDRTLGMLMMGGKELSRQMNESIDLDLSDAVPVRISADLKLNPRQSLKQMFLNNKLQLEVREEYIKNFMFFRMSPLVFVDVVGRSMIVMHTTVPTVKKYYAHLAFSNVINVQNTSVNLAQWLRMIQKNITCA